LVFRSSTTSYREAGKVASDYRSGGPRTRQGHLDAPSISGPQELSVSPPFRWWTSGGFAAFLASLSTRGLSTVFASPETPKSGALWPDISGVSAMIDNGSPLAEVERGS